ncbi:MAG: hypothetical protein RLY57_416 [Candidatus Parcubacteria bacterium]|jgi:glycosyltransferase involved in cell wall biosynthesis
MNISVVVIAHNEEKRIDACLQSLLHQTVQAQEIILIAHNCTDTTVRRAQVYQGVKIVEFNGPEGIVHARVEGIMSATGDMLLCIDGDSIAAPDWVEVMSATLSKENRTLVGSWVRYRGTCFGWCFNFINKYMCNGVDKVNYLWGASFGFFAKDSARVSAILKQSLKLSDQLVLSRNPDDFWLALFMSREGTIEITNKTWVVQNQKEHNSFQAYRRHLENIRNGKKIREYMKSIQ